MKPTEPNRKTSFATTGLFALLCVLASMALTTASAGAEATIAPAPTAGSPGLPDGRVYEQVSPPDKNGNAAGEPYQGTEYPPVMLAEPAGDGVAYTISGGSIGDTHNGGQAEDVAKRTSAGWVSAGAQPESIGENAYLFLVPKKLGFSADLTHVLFDSEDVYLPGVPAYAPLLYDIPDGSLAWLDPPPAGSEVEAAAAEVAGFSTDMSTIYYRTATGFYESHDGTLSVAGVLPDGSVEPEARPAGVPLATPNDPRGERSPLLNVIPNFSGSWLHNQVSEDGTRAFFTAGVRIEDEHYISGTPELYVRETAPDGTQSTVLVSRDTLLPEVGGLPAPAPDGALDIEFPEENIEGEPLSSGKSLSRNSHSESYLYASPDGSRAFFESTDALTSTAREAEEHGLPAGDAKEYMFDTETGALTYLPGVADAPLVELPYHEGHFGGISPILVSSQDGSRFIFNGPSGLSLWSEAGPEGGTVTPIEPSVIEGEARSTPDGSVFVFESAAELAGFNNGGSHCGGNDDRDSECGLRNQEIYRYDVAENSLTCTSCPPQGVVPSGNAYLSHYFASKAALPADPLNSDRGVSEDGSRIFFDTPDPLVPQDVNTGPITISASGSPVEHGRDVYEWENGKLFLISSGTSDQNSYVGDESANGNDVFFSTIQGLVPGDTDEGYDVYDARVPRPGDNPPPAPAECEGEECQGPPSVPSLVTPNGSATFNGLGNPTSGVAAPAVVKPKPKSKACKKGYVKKKNKCVRSKSKRRAKKATTNRRTK
jgi:hypothetical protein